MKDLPYNAAMLEISGFRINLVEKCWFSSGQKRGFPYGQLIP